MKKNLDDRSSPKKGSGPSPGTASTAGTTLESSSSTSRVVDASSTQRSLVSSQEPPAPAVTNPDVLVSRSRDDHRYPVAAGQRKSRGTSKKGSQNRTGTETAAATEGQLAAAKVPGRGRVTSRRQHHHRRADTGMAPDKQLVVTATNTDDPGHTEEEEAKQTSETEERHRYRPPTFFRYAMPMEDPRFQPTRPRQYEEEPSSSPSVMANKPSEDETSEVVVPVATLVNPQVATVVEQKPWYQRRVIWILVAVQVFIAALVTGLVVGLRAEGEPSDSPMPTAAPTTLPTLSPTPMATMLVHPREVFQTIPVAFQESYNSTIEWFGDENIPFEIGQLQRFVLAWFWFAATGNGQEPWLSCNPAGRNVTDQVSPMDDNLNATGDDACQFWTVGYTDGNSICYEFADRSDVRWLSSTLDECTWPGVTCNEKGVVTAIELPAAGLGGRFPYFLSALTSLRKLDLSYGALTGQLPEEIGSFSNLEELDLSRNRLDGQVPESLFSSQLSYLDLAYNSFSGTLPSGIISVTRLFLNNNYFSGPLPEAHEDNLEILHVQNQNGMLANETIPSSWGLLSNLVALDLGQNRLLGTIPETFVNLTQMQVLDLSFNSLQGLLPPMPWPNLRRLSVASNSFSGTFPATL